AAPAFQSAVLTHPDTESLATLAFLRALASGRNRGSGRPAIPDPAREVSLDGAVFPAATA
ncbi:MAG TPA: hypothetical protein VFR49_14020, partial [Solirubrobacteraceae bacterium]|nr:hypothetical protein [Solirubrobacteraceae bacterium]